MKTALPEDIAEFGAVATKRFVRFGGPQAALRARPTNTSGTTPGPRCPTSAHSISTSDPPPRICWRPRYCARLPAQRPCPIRSSRSCWRSTALGSPW